jgi:hypothetical protein
MQSFEIHEKTSPVHGLSTDTYITRVVPIKVTPRSIAALKLSGEEIRDAQTENNGVIEQDCEIIIEPVVDEYDSYANVSDYSVVGINDIELGVNDAMRLRDLLGELTTDESEEIKQSLADKKQESREEKSWHDVDNHYDRTHKP